MAQKSRWSVSGVEPECRVAAKVAARRAGLTIGEWLSRVIMESAKESIQGQELAPVKSELPSAPLNELTDAIESLSELIHKQNARAEKAAEKAAEEAAQRGRAEVEEPIEKAVTPVRENVRKLEEELETKLEALQKGGQDDAGPMQERVREAEAKAERASLAMAPLERKVMRLSQQLEMRQEEAAARRPRERRGLLSRLFGD
ncbi:MAG: hypothetical protein QF521_03300 [Alphaproteobacteria bacterium]|nr:hypothetical protein [Alphaproteobacteria bacterium]